MKVKFSYPLEMTLAGGVSVIVITAAGNFLLSRRLCEKGRGMMQFPGGHIESGETPIEAARRELREETGLNLPASRFAEIGSEIAVGYDGALYIGHRFGVELRADERATNPEPEKHTNWEEFHPYDLRRFKLTANNVHFARSFIFTRRPF